MNNFIPYGHQLIDNADIEAVMSVLKSDFITQGPKIKEFERSLCDYTGARYAVAVSSGTAALHIASLAASIEKGDEVITSPLTFIASANCILYCGARPVFADVENDTGNIDFTQIEKKINKKTKAVIPVHLNGHPCDMAEISKIARTRKLIVIEDAAHALGAYYKGFKVGCGRFSDMTVFSFHPVKAITTGEGGAVLTNDKKFYERLLILRNHGITREQGKMMNRKKALKCAWYYEMQDLGFNYRLTDIQAALGVSQMRKLDSFIRKRRELAAFYNDSFKDMGLFEVPAEREYVQSAYHLYPVRLTGRFKSRRDDAFRLLREESLGVQVHYMPVYMHPYYKKLGFSKERCRVAEGWSARVISLPIYPALTRAQQEEVVARVSTVFKKL